MTPRATTTAASSRLAEVGFVVLEGVIDASACEALVAALDRHAETVPARRWLDVAEVVGLASRLAVDPALATLLPDNATPVLCTLFDKSGQRDWSVGPHQDLAVPLVACADALPGGVSVSHKDGMAFAQPPVAVLESLLAVRVQLDDVTGDAGALDVFPGSHRHGRRSEAGLRELAMSGQRIRVAAPRGGALVLRPLLVHASGKMRVAARRRVLHFLFAPGAMVRRAAAAA
jgi:ectoine hydroxylase-related dioxygenase (phytanoyl-CoA dioxygenase family)